MIISLFLFSFLSHSNEIDRKPSVEPMIEVELPVPNINNKGFDFEQ